MKDERDYSLLPHNTFGIDVRCRRFIEFNSVDELRQVSAELDKAGMPAIIIGGGSNLLFLKDFDGIILHSRIKGVEVFDGQCDGSVKIRCGSGETWDDIVKMCISNGWHGAENLSLIPGEVGAAAVQNIGAYGVEIKDLICQVEVFDLETGGQKTFANKDCNYSYRDSVFKHERKNKYVVTNVTLRLTKEFTPKLDYGNIRRKLESAGITNVTASQLRNAIVEIRKEKLPDPKELGNAGSFFKNPIVSARDFQRIQSAYPEIPHYAVDSEHIKIPAGWLIEQCGWKGACKGNAAVHDRQALVLVNKGGATGREIYELSEQIIADIRGRFGIEISPEVNIIG